jgi:hypothetical protein
MWLGEAQVQGGWRAEAGLTVDDASLTGWREEIDPENADLLGMYGSLLYGQHAGMTDALSLPAVIAAMDILDTPKDERPALARRLIFLHGLVRERERAREKESHGR